MANIPVPTPIRRSTPKPTPISRRTAPPVPKPPPIRVKKTTPPKPKPYNPLTATMPSYAALDAAARQHANADTAAAIAKLPSADDIRRLADATAARQAANQAALQHTASSAGGAFQQAYTAAQQPTNNAIISAGGTPTAGGPAAGAGGALSALGTIMGQGLGGQAAAANAVGLQEILANRRQSSAIQSGTVAAANKYLDDLKQQAFQIAQAKQNNALAQQAYGLNVSKAQASASQAAQNEADKVAIAAANRRAANDRAQLAASTRVATASSRKAAAKSTTPAFRKSVIDTMNRTVRQMLQAKGPTGKAAYSPEVVRKNAVVYLINQLGMSQAAARKTVMQMFPFLPPPPGPSITQGQGIAISGARPGMGGV